METGHSSKAGDEPSFDIRVGESDALSEEVNSGPRQPNWSNSRPLKISKCSITGKPSQLWVVSWGPTPGWRKSCKRESITACYFTVSPFPVRTRQRAGLQPTWSGLDVTGNDTWGVVELMGAGRPRVHNLNHEQSAGPFQRNLLSQKTRTCPRAVDTPWYALVC